MLGGVVNTAPLCYTHRIKKLTAKRGVAVKTDNHNKKLGTLNKKDAYNVMTVSFVAFLCICVIACLLVMQIFTYRKMMSEQVFGETANQRAEMLADLLDSTHKRLTSVAKETTFAIKEVMEETIERESERGILGEVEVKRASEVFDDASSKPYSGIFSDGDVLKMYVFLDKENVVVAEINAKSLSDAAAISNAFGNSAEHIIFDSASGEIIVNTAAKYGFDGTSIGFLTDYAFEDGYSANKMFSDISKKMSGYTEITGNDGQSFSFDYEPIGSEGLYLMQLLPTYSLGNSVMRITKLFFAGIIVLVAGAFLFAVWTSLVAKKFSNEKSEQGYNNSVMKQLLLQVAESSYADMFVYYSEDDEICVFRDREGFHREVLVQTDALNYLANYYGLSEQDERRLKNALAITGSQKELKLDLVSCRDGRSIPLECTLCRVKDVSPSKGAIVCTAVEDTGRYSAEDTAVRDEVIYNTTGVELMLERNMWRFLWNNEKCFDKLGFGNDFRTNYDADLEQNISPLIISRDRQTFLRTLSRLHLLESFRNGNTDICIKYKINTGDGVYECRILDVHMFRDGKTDEIKANLYARHIAGCQ